MIRLVVKDKKYRNNWIRPLRLDSINTMYLFNKKPTRKVKQNEMNKAALCGLSTMMNVSTF